jgi:2-polyprenyl-3-methyl-5-hydroxy-6-metoxy-1,4-benzoquinol methylase
VARFESDPLVERLYASAAATLDLLAVYLGERLGLYAALAEGGPATSAELAVRTGTFERYVREWLEHQAVTGFLEVDDAGAEPERRRYRIPPDHIDVLANPDSIRFQAHKGLDLVRAARPMPELVEAFRSGVALAPLPWGPDGRADSNRARYVTLLPGWLAQIPAIDDRLRSAPPARVADLACGTGWSTLSMAAAYPAAVLEGYDLDPSAMAVATARAEEAGLGERLRFEARDVGELEGSVAYDVVTIFEGLHDMAHPVEVLRLARSLLAPGGLVLVADERVAERFHAPGDLFERYMYGWSVVGCLPEAMTDPDAAGTGAVMRPDTLRRYAEEAGFERLEVLPIEDDLWRFYLLHPRQTEAPRG